MANAEGGLGEAGEEEVKDGRLSAEDWPGGCSKGCC